jgi:hypothetical protein
MKAFLDFKKLLKGKVVTKEKPVARNERAVVTMMIHFCVVTSSPAKNPQYFIVRLSSIARSDCMCFLQADLWLWQIFSGTRQNKAIDDAEACILLSFSVIVNRHFIVGRRIHFCYPC